MAKLGKKLGKLSLAILENFVEKALGEKFVGELRQPTDREAAIESALGKAEDRFAREFKDRAFAENMFTQVNDDDLGLLVDAIEKYYDHPTDSGLPNALNQIVGGSFPDKDAGFVRSAVDLYVGILTEEFMVADEKFREKFRGLADVRSLEVLRRVEALLSQREVPQVENTVFRSLHQLPPAPADFTGREKIIEDLLADFNSHKGATISGLTGMGGIGKTALGLEVAHKIAEKYPNAQIFLDLKGTTKPLTALDIARHIILCFEPAADLRALDETNMQAAYQSVLHGKKALLFLDNARSADQVAPLRPPDSCAMLVTSRWSFPVAGLKPHKVGVMEESEAVAFLLELCPKIGEKSAELARICGLLPLALRIAGSFLQVNGDWNVEKYIAQLSDRKRRLEILAQSREGAELPAAEPDLLATFELSYNQLSEEDRKCWRALGVFPASFAADAAQAMWELEEDETAKLLGLLRRYSLLEYDETSSRYSLHDLLTDFALAQMGVGEEMESRLKHASHYKDVLSAADDLYLKGGENILLSLKLFDLEWENIRTGHDWVAANAGGGPDVKKLSADYPDAGVYVLSLRQHPREKIVWLELSISASREIGDRRREAFGSWNLGQAFEKAGEIGKAIEVMQVCVDFEREIGHPDAEKDAETVEELRQKLKQGRGGG